MKQGSRYLIYFCIGVVLAVLGLMVVFLTVKGVPHLSWDLFALDFTTENQSLMPALIATLYTILGALILAVPIGIATGIYLTQYAKAGFLVDAISIATETLAGIPSILYGLFGMLFFVYRLKAGNSMLSGIVTISIMIVPFIIRTTQEAFLATNPLLKEASLALGATQRTTIMKVLLPQALPGIIGGVVLSIGRIIGESAALIFTMGTVPRIPTSLMDSGRTLAVHMYVLSSEGLYLDKAYATGFVLLIIVLILNLLSKMVERRGTKD